MQDEEASGLSMTVKVNGLNHWWHKYKDLEKEVKFALKYMEAHGYGKALDYEPEFQMWRSLTNAIYPNGKDSAIS